VTLTHLLVSLVKLLTEPLPALPSKVVSGVYATYSCQCAVYNLNIFSGQCEPRRLITEVIKKLCSQESVCEKCLCHDTFTNALLEPIMNFVAKKGVSFSVNISF
jgi:hypothetical protein